MGQADVLEFLKKYKNKWFLAKELMCEFQVARGSIVRTLKRLEETDCIISKPAIQVIYEKDRIKKTTKLALAYKIK
jgi:DNA-binding MarR family transcriptional regulator